MSMTELLAFQLLGWLVILALVAAMLVNIKRDHYETKTRLDVMLDAINRMARIEGYDVTAATLRELEEASRRLDAEGQARDAREHKSKEEKR